MAQVLIRDIDQEVVDRIRARAQRNGKSLEAELRSILRQASGIDREASLRELEKIKQRFAGRTFSDSAELIREDRDR